MSNTLRKMARGIERKAIRQLFVQVFVNRQVWESFEEQLKDLPEDDRPKDATTALHSLIATWVQGRIDAKRRNAGGLIQLAGQLPGDCPEGDLTRRLRGEHGQITETP